MTTAELDAIEAMANAANDGPWRTGTKILRTLYDGHDQLIGCLDEPQDAVFIAAARTDVPELVAEVRRLRKVIGDIADNGVGVGITSIRMLAREALVGGT